MTGEIILRGSGQVIVEANGHQGGIEFADMVVLSNGMVIGRTLEEGTYEERAAGSGMVLVIPARSVAEVQCDDVEYSILMTPVTTAAAAKTECPRCNGSPAGFFLGRCPACGKKASHT